MQKAIFGLALILTLSVPVAAEETAAPTEASSIQTGVKVDIQTSGYFILDMGLIAAMQAVPSIGAGATAGMKTFKNEPFGDIIGGIRLSAQPMKNLEIMINPELKSHNIMPMEPGITGGEKIQKTKWDVYMEEAKAQWTFGRLNAKATFGLMVYKENPDAHIFGDYLFRSMIYPSILFTKFNYPQTQIYGLHWTHKVGSSFSYNAFLISETKYYPFYDLSPAFTAEYSFKNMVEVGAGVNFRSLIPVRPSRLTPAMGNSLDNEYHQIPLQTGTQILDSTGAVVKTVTIRQATDAGGALIDSTWVVVVPTAGIADSILVGGVGVNGLKSGLYSNPALAFSYLLDVQGEAHPELGAAKTRFSFAGTLLTGRIAVNPLGFMGASVLGKNAGKVYLEGAVLGWKNYPGLYEKREERIPIMFGVHLPTFNQLDFLTAEFEHYASKQIPTYKRRSYENIPQPGTYKGETAIENEWSTEARQMKDDWKWAIAAKKSFNAFSLVAQVGTDHTKMTDQNGEEYIDVLTKPSHWYFQFRVIGGIY